MLNAILAPFLRFFELIRSFFFYTIRLNSLTASNFYVLVRKRGKIYTTNEEYKPKGLPREFNGYIWLAGVPFFFSITERLLRAGHSSIDYVSSITFLRFQKKRLYAILELCEDDIKQEIPIYILRAWDPEKIGNLEGTKTINTEYFDSSVYNIFDNAMLSVVNNEKNQTGILLHGAPGNGKSFLLKHFAIKYKIPIYVVAFNNDTNNEQIIRMFSHIEGRCIVLFEDFDSYFDGRKNLLKESSFTLDAILNVIDGSFSFHSETIFVMTTNNIDKIDGALKSRPSRFRHILEIANPSEEVTNQILGNINPNGQSEKIKSMSLDQLLFMRERLDIGDDLDTSIKHVLPFTKKRSRKKI